MIEIALCIVYSILFSVFILKSDFFKAEGLLRPHIIAVFFLKIIFGVLLWWIYTYHYTDRATADIYKYFDDSKVMFDALFTEPEDYLKMLSGIGNDTPHFSAYYDKMNYWHRLFDSNLYNDSHTIIRFNAFVRLFSFGYYNVHTVFMCFLSLTGLMAIYKTFIPFLRDNPKALAVSVFLFPSVLFWSSGVLKEGLLFFAMGMLIYYFHKTINEKTKLKYFIWIAISLGILMATKFYILVSLIPGLLAAFWISRTSTKNSGLKYLTVIILYGIIGLNIHHIIPKYNALKILSIKQNDFINLATGGTYLLSDSTIAFISIEDSSNLVRHEKEKYSIKKGSDYYYVKIENFNDTVFVENSKDTLQYSLLTKNDRAGSLIKIKKLTTNISSLIKAAPNALFNTLFRPHPLEAKSIFTALAALENYVILFIILICVFFRKRSIDYSPVLFCLSFVFILFLITGLTTPVLGALVRYKIPGIPLLIIAFLSILDKEKLMLRIKPLLKIKAG